jgi:hypothetical protein
MRGSRTVNRPKPFYVPAPPNESIIRGRIVHVQPAPGGIGFVWEVEVSASGNVGDLPNLTQSHVGKSILVYVHPELRERFDEGEFIEARVFFQGDERGGAFFLKGSDVGRQP